jgi:hypothetical protein
MNDGQKTVPKEIKDNACEVINCLEKFAAKRAAECKRLILDGSKKIDWLELMIECADEFDVANTKMEDLIHRLRNI